MRKGDKRKIERTVAQLQHFREFVLSLSLSLTLNTLVSLFAPSPLPSFPSAHSFRDLTWRTISYPVIAPLLFPTEDRPIGGKRDAKILDILNGTGRVGLFYD